MVKETKIEESLPKATEPKTRKTRTPKQESAFEESTEVVPKKLKAPGSSIRSKIKKDI